MIPGSPAPRHCDSSAAIFGSCDSSAVIFGSCDSSAVIFGSCVSRAPTFRSCASSAANLGSRVSPSDLPRASARASYSLPPGAAPRGVSAGCRSDSR